MTQQYDDMMMREMTVEFDELTNLSESELKNKSLAKLGMSHYRTIYRIASSGRKNVKEDLVIKFERMLTRYLERYADLGSNAPESQFNQIHSIWSHYKFLLNWNLVAFSYFTRVFVVDLETIGVVIFMERIWRQCAPFVLSVALEQLHLERKGTPIDAGRLAAVLSFGTMIKSKEFEMLYEQNLTKPFVAQLLKDSEALIYELNSSCSSSGEFFRSLVSALESEEKRCALYFPQNRQEGILNVAKDLIRSSETAQGRLMSSDGLLLSLEEGDDAMLVLLFNLFYSDSSDVFSNAFREVVEKIVQNIQGVADAPAMYAKQILDLRRKCLSIVKHCFHGSRDVVATVRSTFVKIFDQKISFRDINRMINFWSCFVILLDCGLRSMEYREYIGEESLSVVSWLHNAEDIIESMAETMLQRVLDPESCFILDLEKRFVEVVTKCIGHRIPLLESIVVDVESSNTFFSCGENTPLNKISFVALRRSNWIATRLVGEEISIPDYIATELTDLRKKYLVETKNKTFKWCNHSSTAVLEARFGRESVKTLFVSAPQAIILLSLNEEDHICMNKLMNAHNFFPEILSMEIEYLLHKKLVVRKRGSSCTSCSSLNSDEIFAVNEEFSSKESCVSLIRWLRREPEELRDEKQTKSTRSIGVDAIILKNLKKKSDSFDNLIKYCHESLQYTVTSSFVKGRIEELIRRELIARDCEELSKFSYLS